MRYAIQKFPSGNYGIADTHAKYATVLIGLTREQAIARARELNKGYVL